MGCCVPGPEGPADEGALLSQLCSVLKDYEGLEEIDKMLGIPTLAGQVGPGATSGPRSLRTNRCISMSPLCLLPPGSPAGPGPVPGLSGSPHEAPHVQPALRRPAGLRLRAP